MAALIKGNRSPLLFFGLVLAALAALNIISEYSFIRLDLTKEKRFTVSQPTKDLIKDLDDVVYFEIYLDGNLPADYRRLQVAITDMLDEYNAYSGEKIVYGFMDVFDNDDPKTTNQIIRSLTDKGLLPRPIAEQSMDEVSQKVLLPGALVHYKGKETIINFLPDKKELNEDAAVVVNKGISTLEYQLSSALRRLRQTRNRRVVFVQGQGEWANRNVGDLAVTLQKEEYEISFMDLTQKAGIDPLVDVAIIAGSRTPWSEKEKFKIDQYIMNGGKVLWVLDGMRASLDSLAGGTEFVSTDLNLNLDDQLFSYGVRLNKDLILDRQANRIPIFTGDGQSQNYFPWFFAPVVFAKTDHPVVKHLDPIMTMFPSSLDTIKVPGIKKTVLLQSSGRSTSWRSPVLVRLNLATNPPMEEQFNKPDLPLAVLLEGNFRSLFKGRVPQNFIRNYQDSLNMSYRESGVPTKMIIVSNAEMIKNEVDRSGRISLLGSYRFDPSYLFANRDFFMNCVDYLADDYGLIATRNKDFKIRPLNKPMLKQNLLKWQAVNILIPVLVILLFGAVYNFIRKRKYTGSV